MKNPVKHFFVILATSILLTGSTFADTVIIDGQAINVWQNGPFLNVGDQTYTVSHIGSSVYIDSVGGSYVPNVTPGQAAKILNSTPEGRASRAKWDSDMKKLASGKSTLDIFEEDMDALNKQHGIRPLTEIIKQIHVPPTTLVKEPPRTGVPVKRATLVKK